MLTEISYEDSLEIKSVANITTKDVQEFLDFAVKGKILPRVTGYQLHNANKSLLEIKYKRIKGAKVLRIN